MSDERKTYTVKVHKANIPLQDSESLDDFMFAVSKAGKDYVDDQLNIISGTGSSWPREIFATTAIFQAIPDWDDSSKDELVQLSFTRSADGEFTFSNLQKVKLITSYEVTKSVAPPSTEDVKKSLWAGIV